MGATCSLVALICQWQLLALLPCWRAQVAAGALVWQTRFPTPAEVPMLALPRYQAAREVRNGCATCAHLVRSDCGTCASCAQPVRNRGAACAAVPLPTRDLRTQVPTASSRKTSGWTLDWPVGSSNHTLSFSTNTRLLTPMARCITPLAHPTAMSPQAQCALCIRSCWGVTRETAPLGAVCSHMLHTPNSEASLLWSPGDDSEDFAPSPVPAVPAQGTSAVGTPVGGLLSRVLRRGHYAPEILHVVEHIPDPSGQTPQPAEKTLVMPTP